MLTPFSTAGLMNFISCSHAVSLFPRSTYLYRRTFVARQEDVSSDLDPEGMKARLARYSENHGLKTIGLSHNRISDVEVGQRYVGDSMCWTISCFSTGTPINPPCSIDLPRSHCVIEGTIVFQVNRQVVLSRFWTGRPMHVKQAHTCG